MIKKQRIIFFCSFFLFFIISYLFFYLFISKLVIKENLENISYIDIINRLFIHPTRYKQKNTLKNNTYLGGNSGPIV
jgi:hypothetical protein